ncbi:hypothetical protein [Rhodanobacter terrae]|uniref:Uncharacterized protein n=1 Tax=Rhodanobacter terrae TaxID=418647 RepID=A0ABW0SYM9_9GAMM
MIKEGDHDHWGEVQALFEAFMPAEVPVMICGGEYALERTRLFEGDASLAIVRLSAPLSAISGSNNPYIDDALTT